MNMETRCARNSGGQTIALRIKNHKWKTLMDLLTEDDPSKVRSDEECLATFQCIPKIHR